MMGHGYYGNKLPDQERHEQRFAWWPTRSSFNKKRIWLKTYHIVHVLYDRNGRPPIKGWSWQFVYTKNEYLMMLLKNEN